MITPSVGSLSPNDNSARRDQNHNDWAAELPQEQQGEIGLIGLAQLIGPFPG